MKSTAHGLGRTLRLAAACALVAALAGCGGSANTTSVNLSGNITGLTDAGLSLSSGVSRVFINANSTSFTFPSRVLIGSAYQVVVATLPPTLICTIANGTGVSTSNSDINTVQVTCVPRNSLGGTITGLSTAGLVLANGSDTVSPAAGAQSFVFPGLIGQGFSYGVTVLAQPAGKACAVLANNSGIMGATNINNVQVSCQ